MKILYLLLFFAASTAAQDKDCLLYDEFIKTATNAKKTQEKLNNYRAAIVAARDCGWDKEKEVNDKIDALFAGIEKERDEAKKLTVIARKQATELGKRQKELEAVNDKLKKEQEEKDRALETINASNDKLKKEQEEKEEALKELEAVNDKLKKEQEEKEEALKAAKAERNKNKNIIDAFYFYDEKFALSYKEKSGRGVYGFINKEGETVIDFKYQEAESFSKKGYAKVKKEDIEYWIDTVGNEYKLWIYREDLLEMLLGYLKMEKFQKN